MANWLYVRRSKCSFGQQSINYLGHIIERNGVAMDREKIKAMLEWQKPPPSRPFMASWDSQGTIASLSNTMVLLHAF
jgi:hypothetical protein